MKSTIKSLFSANLQGFIIVDLHNIGVRSVSRMGRKLRLSVHRKNEERKKYAVTSLPVSIPLEKVSVYKVSIPLRFNISLPLSVYASAPAPSIQHLKSRLEVTHTLPQGTHLLYCICTLWHVVLVYHAGWSVTIDGGDSGVERTSLTLFNLRRHHSSEVPSVFYTLKVFNDFSWTVYVGDNMVCGDMIDFVGYKSFIGILNYRYHIHLPYW